MFYTFYLGKQKDFNSLKDIIKNIINNIANNDMVLAEDSNHEFEIDCVWFNLNASDNAKGILFTSEDYNMQLEYLLWFEIHYLENYSSEKIMMEVIGDLMKVLDCDCILFSNNDKPILERKDNKVTVDDSKLNSSERFPFKYMDIEYLEGHLAQI
ncbi:hypothetical protein [Clostridium sp. KNHs205]|uniref:hypothetical protein n=1 Tax=Clostridium sp. KNHs205 TaxID=1449050 RepID=UPI00051B0DD6|nr:hypothetical protein [Clostridium sp. KNHs205]